MKKKANTDPTMLGLFFKEVKKKHVFSMFLVFEISVLNQY